MNPRDSNDETVSPSFTIEGLEQKEAHLLLMNKQVDADARAVMSDAEHFLQRRGSYSVPIAGPSHVHSSFRTPIPSGPARAIRSSFNVGEERGCSGVRTTPYASGAQEGSAGSLRIGGEVRSMTGSSLDAKTLGAKSASRFSSPISRVSQRVKEAARASGERSGRDSPSSINRQTDSRQTQLEGLFQGERSRPVTQEARGAEGDADNWVMGVPPGIGAEATTRFLKAKLGGCQAQLEDVHAAHRASQQETVQLRQQVAMEQEEKRRVSRQLQQLQQTVERDQKAMAKEEGGVSALKKKISDLEQELSVASRLAKQAETDKKSLEVRLHRSVEEVARQKAALADARGQQKEAGQGQRMEAQRLEGQCQRLERQKLELLSAFKKQLKLIDVLKRQKFHVEAARLLAFTEEEFVKTLDWAT
ncbi:unnamed protein product [Choristocarpus tenellus]